MLALRFHGVGLVVGCSCLAAIGFGDMAWIVFGVSRRTGSDPLLIKNVQDVGSDVSGYLATYLLPFLTVAQPNLRDIIAYALFIVVAGLIYVRSDMSQINPTLYLLGMKVLRVTTEEGWNGYIIAHSSIATGRELSSVPLNNEVRVEAKKK